MKKTFYEKKSEELKTMLQRKEEFNSSIENEIKSTQAQLAALSAQEVPTSGPCNYTELFRKQAELQTYLQILTEKKAQGFGKVEIDGISFIAEIKAEDRAEEEAATEAIRPLLQKIYLILKERQDSRLLLIDLANKYEREVQGILYAAEAYGMAAETSDTQLFRQNINKTRLFKKTVGEDILC